MVQSIVIYSFAILFFYQLADDKSRSYTIYENQLVNKARNKFLTPRTVLLLLSFTLFCGLRYDVGTDYLAYLACYLDFDSLGDYVSGEYEVAFSFLLQLCNSLRLSPPFFFGLVAFLQMFFFLLAFKRERYIWPLLILFFFVDDGFLLWMNGLRQCVALCVWLFSLSFIERKTPMPYLLLCAMAALFHTSAAVLIILYPFFRNGKDYFNNIFIQYVIILIAFGIRILFNDMLINVAEWFTSASGLYENYLESISKSEGYGNTYLVYWFRLIIYLIIIYYSEEMKLFYNTNRFKILYTLFFIGVISRCIIPFNMSILSRFFLYFTFIEPIMLAFFVFYLSNKSSGSSQMIKLLIIVSFVAIFYLNQIVSGKGSSVWYQFYFDQHIIFS